MIKKHYAQPTISVEEYEMTIITSASQLQSISGNSGLSYGGSDADYVSSGSGAMGKGRGIWDED